MAKLNYSNVPMAVIAANSSPSFTWGKLIEEDTKVLLRRFRGEEGYESAKIENVEFDRDSSKETEYCVFHAAGGECTLRIFTSKQHVFTVQLTGKGAPALKDAFNQLLPAGKLRL
ncbi:MAG: hypothetical protein ACWGQW_08630 [bacterium]